MTYKSRTGNEKTKQKKTCAINGRLFPLKWYFLWMAAHCSDPFLYFVPSVVWSQLS